MARHPIRPRPGFTQTVRGADRKERALQGLGVIGPGVGTNGPYRPGTPGQTAPQGASTAGPERERLSLSSRPASDGSSHAWILSASTARSSSWSGRGAAPARRPPSPPAAHRPPGRGGRCGAPPDPHPTGEPARHPRAGGEPGGQQAHPLGDRVVHIRLPVGQRGCPGSGYRGIHVRSEVADRLPVVAVAARAEAGGARQLHPFVRQLGHQAGAPELARVDGDPRLASVHLARDHPADAHPACLRRLGRRARVDRGVLSDQ